MGTKNTEGVLRVKSDAAYIMAIPNLILEQQHNNNIL